MRLATRYLFLAIVFVVLVWIGISYIAKPNNDQYIYVGVDVDAHVFKNDLSHDSDIHEDISDIHEDISDIHEDISDIHEDISPVDVVDDIVVGNKERLVTIDYFKQYYKTSLNPQPGSARMGGDAVVNSAAEQQRENISLNEYGFNEVASSKISLERTIPDNRAQA